MIGTGQSNDKITICGEWLIPFTMFQNNYSEVMSHAVLAICIEKYLSDLNCIKFKWDKHEINTRAYSFQNK